MQIITIISSEDPKWREAIANAFAQPIAKAFVHSRHMRRIHAMNRALFNRDFQERQVRARYIRTAFNRLDEAAHTRRTVWPAMINRFERYDCRLDHAAALNDARELIHHASPRLP